MAEEGKKGATKKKVPTALKRIKQDDKRNLRNRSFKTKVRTAIRSFETALSAKAANGQLIVLDNAKASEPKTKAMVAKLAAMGIQSALFVCGEEMDHNFALAIRNIPHIDVLSCEGANVYDILRHDTLVLTKDAVENLTKRLAA